MSTDINNFIRYDKYLSTMIGVRPVGSHGLELSAAYITEMMRENGLETFLQPFRFEEYTVSNVIGVKRALKEAKRILIFVAHYDTVPVARGAMDNASGVSVVLELSRALKGVQNNFTELRFIALAGEEVGCVGSKAYVQNMTEDEKEKTVAAYNFDMFASRGDEEVALVCGTLGGTDESPKDTAVSRSVEKAFESLKLADKIELWSPRNYGHSDHETFANAGIDSANVTIRGTRARNGKLAHGYHSKDDVFCDYDLVFTGNCLEAVYQSAKLLIE